MDVVRERERERGEKEKKKEKARERTLKHVGSSTMRRLATPSVSVKIRANYNERSLRMYFEKWEQKGATGQKFVPRGFTRRCEIKRTRHSMRRVLWLLPLRALAENKLKVHSESFAKPLEIPVSLLLNFARTFVFSYRAVLFFVCSLCACAYIVYIKNIYTV